MLFKGRLRLPGDAGEGIPIDLTLEDVYLTLDSNGEGLGEWRLDVVEISRLFSNQFSLLLDGEEMVFVAADALGFAYEGLSFVEEVQSRLKKRRFFKGRKPKRSKAKPAPTEPQPQPEEPARSTPSSAPVPKLATPEIKPFFPEAAEARMAGDQDAPASATSEPSPVAEPVAEPEVHQTPRRSLHPLGDPDEEVVDAYLDVPTPTEVPPAATSTAPAPAAPDITEPETPHTTEAGSPGPDIAAPAATDDVVEDEADDELVIEDVNPYGYQSPVTAIPEREARSDSEGTAGAPPAQESTHLVEPEPEPESVVPVAEQAIEPMVEEEPQAPQVAESPTPEPIASAESSSEDAAGADMDHVDESEPDEAPKTRVTQRTGRHAKGESGSRSSFFGRRKSKDPDPHDHVYESSKTVGGITRRICSVCGHVSFAGEDVYQDW